MSGLRVARLSGVAPKFRSWYRLTLNVAFRSLLSWMACPLQVRLKKPFRCAQLESTILSTVWAAAVVLHLYFDCRWTCRECLKVCCWIWSLLAALREIPSFLFLTFVLFRRTFVPVFYSRLWNLRWCSTLEGSSKGSRAHQTVPTDSRTVLSLKLHNRNCLDIPDGT